MTTTSNQVFRVLGEGLVSRTFLRRLFKVSELTIMLWQKNKGLPYVKVPGEARDSIRYDLDEVKVWARTHGKRMYVVETPNQSVEG